MSAAPRSTLRARLLLSHLAVALVGVAALLAVGLVVGGALLDRQQGRMGPGMMNGGPDDAREAVRSLLPGALVAGGIAALMAAAVVAWLVTRSILGPLQGLREAAHRIAAGDYAHRMPAPRDAELAEVTRDIDALAERLGETEARRTRLIDEVAHEMRTPVTTISGTMEGLLDEVITPSPEVWAKLAAEASRLGRLADDLSTLSRAEENSLTLHLAPIDLADVARAVAARLESQFEDADVRLAVSTQPAQVSGDADRLTQVLTNLVGNALRHSPAGTTVELGVDAGGGTARATVVDHGRGIAAEDIGRVFERFYRVPDAHSAGGRGIGLTIARSLARAHGGDVTAASAGLGAGSTFRLTLPSA